VQNDDAARAWWSSTFGTSPADRDPFPSLSAGIRTTGIAAELGRDACYLAGLARYRLRALLTDRSRFSTRWRTGRTRQAHVRGGHQRSIRAEDDRHPCYASNSTARKRPARSSPRARNLYTLVETQNAHYGSLIRRRYGEPFFTYETMVVDDVVKLEGPKYVRRKR